ncbi:phosphotransferase [Microbacterium sp. K24]|uniref:phosphotransferase n=1 Tax=Microbacterium sp. K24 TaxID=2305446 RepID=UPI001F11424F|nr:phosphotransferase [Microbacterium sp. K24]
MGRSPFTLAAAVTAALPGAEVTGARPLSADGDGRFDSAVASLADGRELAIRVADDEDTARELAAEALALRALTDGARAMLPFHAPEYIGETTVGKGRALVTELLPGFQIEAALVPAGRGAAESMGAAIAAVHGLPTSVVRGAGLVMRSAEESRSELNRLVDAAASTGRVPARLTVRWRDAVADDDLWRFESTVVLGGVQATSFLFADDPERGPEVTGLLGWHGLSVGDPAIDLSWLSAAPDAAADVHAAYARTVDRAPDAGLEVRARLLAELEFARWLVHGDSMRRPDIVDDAAALLESLAEGLRTDDLSIIAARSEGVDSALDALGRVPAATAAEVDTSMQTDAYNPNELWADGGSDTGEVGADDARGETSAPPWASDGQATSDAESTEAAHRAEMLNVETEDLSGVAGLFAGTNGAAGVREDSHPLTPRPGYARTADGGAADDAADDDSGDDSEEAQRAARAALQRWKSSSSE